MLITNQQRQEAYKKLPEEIKLLYSSDSSTALGKTLKEKYSIDNNNYGAFLDATGDVILGFYKIADLPKLLQENAKLAPDVAKKITAELIEVWEYIVQRETDQAKANQEKSEAEAAAKKESISTLTEKLKTTPPSTPAEAAEKHETIAPIRTMQTDARMHGYGAKLEQEQQEVAETLVKATPQDEIQKPST